MQPRTNSSRHSADAGRTAREAQTAVTAELTSPTQPIFFSNRFLYANLMLSETAGAITAAPNTPENESINEMSLTAKGVVQVRINAAMQSDESGSFCRLKSSPE